MAQESPIGSEHELKAHHAGTAPATLDPVCGMTVDPARAAGSVDHAGRTYFFCSAHCTEQFRAAPGKYVGAPANHAAAAAPEPLTPAVSTAGSEYTCPMHPEV